MNPCVQGEILALPCVPAFHGPGIGFGDDPNSVQVVLMGSDGRIHGFRFNNRRVLSSHRLPGDAVVVLMRSDEGPKEGVSCFDSDGSVEQADADAVQVPVEEQGLYIGAFGLPEKETESGSGLLLDQ